MGGGLPISVCIGDVMNVWEKNRKENKNKPKLFFGKPTACAIAYDTIKAIQKNCLYFK